MKHRATQHDVRKGVWERHRFDGFDAEVGGREARRQGCREAPRAFDRLWICVRAEDVISFPEKVHEVAAGPAPRVQHSHAGRDAAFQQLVEQINIDRSKLLEKVSHAFRIVRCL
jgi:hypothetical protein